MIGKLVSDLHIGVSDYDIPEDTLDKDTVLFVAGDINEGTGHLPLIKNWCERFKSVIYVLGNHEYYMNDMKFIDEFWTKISNDIPNFYFLNNDKVVIDGVRIIGSTLWSDIDADNNLDNVILAERYINDYRSISNDGKLVTPYLINHIHNQSVNYIENELTNDFDGKTVLMTHHSPSMKFVDSMYKDSEINFCFHSNLDWIFRQYHVDFAFFGHTHQCIDMEMYGTRFISNQRGYQSMYGHGEYTGFDSSKIFEM